MHPYSGFSTTPVKNARGSSLGMIAASSSSKSMNLMRASSSWRARIDFGSKSGGPPRARNSWLDGADDRVAQFGDPDIIHSAVRGRPNSWCKMERSSRTVGTRLYRH